MHKHTPRSWIRLTWTAVRVGRSAQAGPGHQLIPTLAPKLSWSGQNSPNCPEKYTGPKILIMILLSRSRSTILHKTSLEVIMHNAPCQSHHYQIDVVSVIKIFKYYCQHWISRISQMIADQGFRKFWTFWPQMCRQCNWVAIRCGPNIPTLATTKSAFYQICSATRTARPIYPLRPLEERLFRG